MVTSLIMKHLYRALTISIFAALSGQAVAAEPQGLTEAQAEAVASAAEESAKAPAVQPQKADPAFEKAISGILPMSPDQIRAFEQSIRAAEDAAGTPQGPITPVSRSIDLSLKPGETPPTVHMALGNASTLTFSDVTGQPWPVLSVTTGNPMKFSAQPAGKAGETNIIVVAPKANVAQSNLVVTLVGYPVPVMLLLESGYQSVDFRLDMRVAARGPNALYDLSSVGMLPSTKDAKLLAFLDGTPPETAKPLETTSADVEAWAYDGDVYVRSSYTLLSPAYTAKSSNVSGVNVYSLQDSPVLIISDNGQMRSVGVSQAPSVVPSHSADEVK